VLMTGAFEPIDDKRAEACQADAVLVKPFEPQQVVSLVKRMLAGERGPMLGEFAPPQASSRPASAGGSVTLAPGVDTYAQRLDEHLAARQRRPVVVAGDGTPADEREDRSDVEPTHDASAAGAAEPTDTAAGEDAPAGGRESLAETFSAILAAERGEGPEPAVNASTPEITDAFVDAVADRVVRRLTDTHPPELVSRHVLDVAERLVSEEIERIKSGVS